MTAAARRREVAVAGHVGDEPAARRGLRDAEPQVRATALGALERLGVLGDDELRAALRDPAPPVRRRGAEVAARHPDVSLLGALDDADVGVVEMAAWAVGEQAEQRSALDRRALERLVGLARAHDDPLVREAAVAALGALGDAGGLPAILGACRDKPAVRRRAVIALAAYDGPDVDAALHRALTDRDWQVRQAAEDLLDPPLAREQRDRERQASPSSNR